MIPQQRSLDTAFESTYFEKIPAQTLVKNSWHVLLSWCCLANSFIKRTRSRVNLHAKYSFPRENALKRLTILTHVQNIVCGIGKITRNRAMINARYCLIRLLARQHQDNNTCHGFLTRVCAGIFSKYVDSKAVSNDLC